MIEEAVQQQVEALVNNDFKRFDVNKVVERVINDDKYFGSKNLKRDIVQEISKQIIDRMHLELIVVNVGRAITYSKYKLTA